MSDSNTTLPNIPRYKPYYGELKKGRPYAWCSCGLSAKQPFCDGSHKGTGFEPVRYVAKEDGEEVLFCGCKHSKDQPFCDGSHNNLMDEYTLDDPASEANASIPMVEQRVDGRAMLDGGCFALDIGEIALQSEGNTRWAPLVTRDSGAKHQAQFYFEAEHGSSPVIAFGDCDTVLLATSGSGEVEISGRQFNLAPGSGIYVRPGEAFRVHNADNVTIKLFASVGPLADAPDFADAMPNNFDAEHPTRAVAFDPDNREPMADRSFQVLIDKAVGSEVVTQFIGEIPRSKAAPHRHLYEEILILLSGEGMMWTESLKAPVKAGDIIFLPRKQVHSLECTDPGGMAVAGVIYPGDNPSINY